MPDNVFSLNSFYKYINLFLMKRKFSFLLFAFLLIFSALNLNSCKEREETVNCFPKVPINVTLNLSLPHICPGNNTTLNVESNIKIICPADGAEWILLTGQPTKVSPIAPKTYRYNFDSGTNFLTIFE